MLAATTAVVTTPAGAASVQGGPAPSTDGVVGVSITPGIDVLTGGDGEVIADVSQVAAMRAPVRALAIDVRAPRGISMRSATGSGWRCAVRPSGRRVRCLRPPFLASAGAPPIRIRVDAGVGGRYTAGQLRATARWQQRLDGRWSAQTSGDAVRVVPRRPLEVRARVDDKRIADRIDGAAEEAVALHARVRRRDEQGGRYEWRQICDRDRPCPRVRWMAPRIGDLTSDEVESSFSLPNVARRTKLRFEVKVADHRGEARDRVAIEVLPQEVARFDPRLASTRPRGPLSQRRGTGGRVGLDPADRARVIIGGRGATHVRAGGRVRIRGDVAGQRERKVRWSVVSGPRSLLAGVRRNRQVLQFRAPRRPGTIVLRMAAWTRHGRFVRDEIVNVLPRTGVVAAGAAGAQDVESPALAASRPRARDDARASDGRRTAFCAAVASARRGEIDIPLSSGRLRASVGRRPAGSGCTGNETIEVRGASASLGQFALDQASGTITLEQGLVIRSGILRAPAFWASSAPDTTAARVQNGRGQTADGRQVETVDAAEAARVGQSAGARRVSIPFVLPKLDRTDVRAGLGVRLGMDGWGDLAGELGLARQALGSFPMALPSGFALTDIYLRVQPAQQEFVLSAEGQGPAGATVALSGSLSFDGAVRASVQVANLAVLQSDQGQATVSATGTFQMLPGRLDSPAGSSGGAVFPHFDINVSGAVNNYRPAAGVALSGRISWSTRGPLRIDGTMRVDARDRGITLGVDGEYTGPGNWRLNVALDTASGLRIGDLFTLRGLGGTVSRTGSGINFDVSGEVADVNFRGLGVRLDSATARLTTSECAFEGPLAQTVATRTTRTSGGRQRPICLKLDATVTLPGVGDGLTINSGIVVDLATHQFSVAGGVQAKNGFGPRELNLRDVRLWATNAVETRADCAPATESGADANAAARGRVSFGFTARGRALGIDLRRVTGAYTSTTDDYCLEANIGSAALANSGGANLDPVPPSAGCGTATSPTLHDLTLRYASTDRRIALTGGFCLPRQVREGLGAAGSGRGDVRLEITHTAGSLSLDGRVSYTLPAPVWVIGGRPGGRAPDPNRTAVALRSMALAVTASQAGMEIGVQADGQLQLPAPPAPSGFASRQPAIADVSVAATAVLGGANPGLRLIVAVGAAGNGQPQACTRARAAFRDLFGQSGLHVCGLGLSGTISSPPSVALAADFALPPEWGRDLGIANASFRLGASISVQEPCLDFAITQRNRSQPAIDLFNRGAFVANQLHIGIAPTGCALPGPGGGTRLPAGANLVFEGAIGGVTVDVNAQLRREGDSFAVNATVNAGRFNAGPVEFGATRIAVVAQPSRNEFRLGISTSMRLGARGNFALNAEFDTSGSGRSRTTTLNGDSNVNFRLGPGSFSGRMAFAFERRSSGQTTATFSGRLRAQLVLTTTNVDLRKLDYDSTQGGLQTIDFSAAIDTRVGPLALAGRGSLYFSRGDERLMLALNGRFSVWNAFTRSVDLRLNLGRIDLPFTIPRPPDLTVFGVGLRFDGGVRGAVVWTPNTGVRVTVNGGFGIRACAGVCVNLSNIRVDPATGNVRIQVFRFDPFTIPAGRWAR